MASRSLDDLAGPVRECADAFVLACRAQGLDVLIYCTLRSNTEQGHLYEQGRTKPGRIVTNAKPGQSLHNPDDNGKSWAFDAVPMSCGAIQWFNAAMLADMGSIGESVGLEWAGRWSGSLRESVHFQIKRG